MPNAPEESTEHKADPIELWVREATNRINRNWYRWAEGTHEPIYRRDSSEASE